MDRRRLASRSAPLSMASLWVALSLASWIVLTLAATTVAAAQSADLILHGGAILTMTDGDEPEAVAVRGERIVFVGSMADAKKLQSDSTRSLDLGGRALLPGFIDAHGHLSFQARTVALANLQPPPAGPIESILALRDALQAYARARDLGPGDWVVGNGYDDSLLAEGRHPEKSDLDDIFPHNPVALVHVSGHLAVANSQALHLVGYSAATANPKGGVIRRVEDSDEPNGVLEETAIYPLLGQLGGGELDDQLALLEQAQKLYASFGLTTAQDGATDLASLSLLEEAARRGRLSIDVIAYPRGTELRAAGDDVVASTAFGSYQGRLRIGGIKLVLDGSPQGKTAYLTLPFHVPPAGQDQGYRGYPIAPQAEVDEIVEYYHSRGIRMLAHANGDAAGDQLLHALERVAATRPLGDHRTVMIHAQIMRPEQVTRVAELGIVPSFFVAHTFFWGDWHRDSVLGAARADFISPLRSAKNAGIAFTIHNDAPIVPPDMLRLVWTAVNRRTRSGDILGPLERVDVMDALRAITIHAARQHFEERDKGSIEVGKLADLVILGDDPRAVEPAELHALAVVETISRGKTVFQADGAGTH